MNRQMVTSPTRAVGDQLHHASGSCSSKQPYSEEPRFATLPGTALGGQVRRGCTGRRAVPLRRTPTRRMAPAELVRSRRRRLTRCAASPGRAFEMPRTDRVQHRVLAGEMQIDRQRPHRRAVPPIGSNPLWRAGSGSSFVAPSRISSRNSSPEPRGAPRGGPVRNGYPHARPG